MALARCCPDACVSRRSPETQQRRPANLQEHGLKSTPRVSPHAPNSRTLSAPMRGSPPPADSSTSQTRRTSSSAHVHLSAGKTLGGPRAYRRHAGVQCPRIVTATSMPALRRGFLHQRLQALWWTMDRVRASPQASSQSPPSVQRRGTGSERIATSPACRLVRTARSSILAAHWPSLAAHPHSTFQDEDGNVRSTRTGMSAFYIHPFSLHGGPRTLPPQMHPPPARGHPPTRPAYIEHPPRTARGTDRERTRRKHMRVTVRQRAHFLDIHRNGWLVSCTLFIHRARCQYPQ